MKLPKGLPNYLVVRTWMEQGKGGDANVQASSFVSPIWKQNGDSHPHVVTLGLRPFRTTNLSLDSFMASHSPRRNCGNKQKFMLKPLDLDQRNCSANIHATFGKDALGLSVSSSSKVHNRISQDRDIVKSDRPHSNSSQGGSRERKVSASVVTLGDYHGGASKQCVPDSLYNCRNNSFRPSPRLSQATGHKTMIWDTFSFNYPGYMNILQQQQQTELVATGMPVTTIMQKQTQTKPILRWQSRGVANEKNSKYTDPMLAASPSFQARMAEITQHELDTVKWERGKKGKKKNPSSS